jgi:hypothetical protein
VPGELIHSVDEEGIATKTYITLDI